MGDNCDHYYSSPMGDASNCRRDLVCANVCTVDGNQPLGAACTAATECASGLCRVDLVTMRKVCSPVVECALRPSL